MAAYPLDSKLDDRLVRTARRLKLSPQECLNRAVLAYVESCEDAARQSAELGDGVARPPDGFYD